MKKLTVIVFLCLFTTAAGAQQPATNLGAGEFPDPIFGERDFLRGYTSINPDGTVNVAVECPAGTTAKWAVDRDGAMRLEIVNGIPRHIQYLPFLANYGIVPRTYVSSEVGGEGEQLDIQIIGDRIERGSVVRAHVIGALALLDRGSQDEKLLAVVHGSSLGTIRDIEELEARFPGITEILETWWLNFKGHGVTSSQGWVGAQAAMRHVRAASGAFENEESLRSPQRVTPGS